MTTVFRQPNVQVESVAVRPSGPVLGGCDLLVLNSFQGEVLFVKAIIRLPSSSSVTVV